MTTERTTLDVVIIGAGPAGLSIGYYLKKYGINFLIFERSKPGSSWRDQRWDSFRMNTPNSLNQLPGIDSDETDPEGFYSAAEFLRLLDDYVKKFLLPVVESSNVQIVERDSTGRFFKVVTCSKGTEREYCTKCVVIASGIQNQKVIPDFSTEIPSSVFQLHSSEYKNESQLPDGSTLVIGSGQSGAQITQDLIESGRKVYLSTSKVGRLPRKYRGYDVEEWLLKLGVYEDRTFDLIDFSELEIRQPLISGVGPEGRTLSLQALGKQGATILGKVDRIKDGKVFLQPNARANIEYGDETSRRIKEVIDSYIREKNLTVPQVQMDDSDLPDVDGIYASNIPVLNLQDANITSIIWATGFNGDFGYLKVPFCDENGKIIQREGVSSVNGLYFIGLPWMRKRKSSMLWGIKEDAEYVASRILENLK